MSGSRSKRRETPLFVKQFFFLLNTVITVNYLTWRLLYTIPFRGRTLSMLVSLGFALLPVLREISSGTRVILLTVGLSAAAAVIRPVGEARDEE